MESIYFTNNVTLDINFETTGLSTAETTLDTFMEEVKTYTEFKVANLINEYWNPILVPIGIVGNTLSFFVMMKANNRKMSTCIYMAAISINDNLLMYACIHAHLVDFLQVHKWNATECNFVAFVSLFTLQNCTFQILAMTMDKYIAIKWPHRAATYSIPERARMVTIILYICVFIYNIPHFLYACIHVNTSSSIPLN